MPAGRLKEIIHANKTYGETDDISVWNVVIGNVCEANIGKHVSGYLAHRGSQEFNFFASPDNQNALATLR